MSQPLSNPAEAVAVALANQRAAFEALHQAMEILLEPAGLIVVALSPSSDGYWTLQVRADDASVVREEAASSKKLSLPLPKPTPPAQLRVPKGRRKEDPAAPDSTRPSTAPRTKTEPVAEPSAPLSTLGLPKGGDEAKDAASKAAIPVKKSSVPVSEPKSPESSAPVRPIAPGVQIEDISHMSSEVTEGYRVPNMGRKRENPLRARETDPRVRAQQLARTLVGEIIVYRRLEHQAALAQDLPTLRTTLKGDIARARAQFMHDVDASLAGERDDIFVEAVNTIIGRGQPVLPMP